MTKTIDIEQLSNKTKKLSAALVELSKQLSVHTPTNVYLPALLIAQAKNAAAKDIRDEDAKMKKDDGVLFTFRGIPVKQY